MDQYEVTRAAVELQKIEQTPESLAIEIEATKKLIQRFRRLSVGYIFVSFTHMATTLILFSSEHWYEKVAQVAMTIGVDYAIWVTMGYVHYVKKEKEPISWWIWWIVVFAFLLVASLNFSFMYTKRPSPELLPEPVSIVIAVAFAIFVPLCVAGGAHIHGKLEDKLLFLQKRLAAKTQRKTTIRDVRNSPSQRHNEAQRNQLPSPNERYGNGKSEILTNDVEGILEALNEAGIRRFAYASDIGRCCGWSSPSSSTKALNALREAGVVRKLANGYEVIEREVC